MRTCNKHEAFALARQLGGDLDHEALDDATLEGFWTKFRCEELPEPLDAICLQCVVALPASAAVRLFQSVAYHAPIDGLLDDAVMASILKQRSTGIEELLLLAQSGYYIGDDASDHRTAARGVGELAGVPKERTDTQRPARRVAVPGASL